MGKLLGLFMVCVVICMVAAVAAYKWFGVWGVVGLIAIGVFGLGLIKWLLGRMLMNLFTAPFKAKGAVLNSAAVQVHDVVSAPAPVFDDEDDLDDLDDPDRLHWYHVDVTITPQTRDSRGQGFTMWEPGELMLAGPDAAADAIDEDEDEICYVHDVAVWQGDAFRLDDEGKYEGPQRIRMHVGIKSGTERLKFRYYFELFGDVAIPA